MRQYVLRLLSCIFGIATLALAACGPSQQPAERGKAAESKEAAIRLSVQDFERSSFCRRHPPKTRQSEAGTVAYSFDDAYSESRRIVVELGSNPDRISTITVTWFGETYRPAAWSSIKKQFIADLMESTFWDVDYGQVSSYVLEHQKDLYSPAQAAAPMGESGVRIRAGTAGSGLVVSLAR